MIKEIKILPLSIFLLLSIKLFAGLVDTSGNPVTNETQLGDIDMKVSTFGDVKQHVMTTNVVKDIITNTVVVGYTDWTYSGSTIEGVTYSITFEPSGGQYVFTLWNASTAANLGTTTSDELNPTSLSFNVSSGTIVASRNEIRRNANGFAMYSDLQALEQKIDDMDTSYFRTVGITNKNQSVQYVYTDAQTTDLQILMPTNGMTKDWLVYILPSTNVTLHLPPANYWATSESVTNDIPMLTPTALYFSQINEDTFSLGRQELTAIITIDPPSVMMSKAIKAQLKKAGVTLRSAKRSVPATNATTK